MFLWDDIGETKICFEGAAAATATVSALLDACTVPIAVHDHACAGILGNSTLLRDGDRHLLLTAAHLFEGTSSSGNWLVPCRHSGQLLSLEGAQVQTVQGCDIALIYLARTRARARLLEGRVALPMLRALRRVHPAHRGRGPAAQSLTEVSYCVAGYPAAWSRFERGYLAARRLTIATLPSDAHSGELRCHYGRVAERSDGQTIHTPALEGMNGAAIWEIRRDRGRRGKGGASSTLCLAGVQSAFMHGRYLRGDLMTQCKALLLEYAH